MNRKFAYGCVVLGTLAMGACAASKSADPLSPTVAGPIPGVAVSSPAPMQPGTNAKIAVDQQPLLLVVNNASSSGVRPLTYLFEIAADVDFTNKVFSRDGIAPGPNGQTSLRLPDALATGRTYFWHARAEDGANTGPFSPTAAFEVFTPIVIGAPVLIAPIDNVKVDSLHPVFTWANAPHSGPVGRINYIIELSESDSFANKTIWTVDEGSGRTSLESPADLGYSNQYFWHARAVDPTTAGPWSNTHVFQTPEPPPPPVVIPSPGGGGGTFTGHVGPGPLSAERARQVVFATAAEFPHLTRVFGSEGEAVDAAGELLLRTIWHMQLAGFQSGRQRNPSGVISGDKITIFADGTWRIYDIYSLGVAGRATTVQFIELTGVNPVQSGGIPD